MGTSETTKRKQLAQQFSGGRSMTKALMAGMAISLLASHSVWASEVMDLSPVYRAASGGKLKDMEVDLDIAQKGKLPHYTKVIYISGYDAENIAEYGTVSKITLNLPSSKVLLVLSSHDKMDWRVATTRGTEIAAILISGSRESWASSLTPAKGTRITLPSGENYFTENKQEDMPSAHRRFLSEKYGIENIEAARVKYSIPHEMRVSASSSPKPNSLEITEITKPTESKVRYFDHSNIEATEKTPLGPSLDDFNKRLKIGEKTVKALGKIFSFSDDGGIRSQLENGGQETSIKLPRDFPEFSWPNAIAYDSKRNLVTVVTIGGEGFLYRFSPAKKQWIDFRSMQHIDVSSMAYDEANDYYLARTSSGYSIIDGDCKQMTFVKPNK